MNFEVIINNKPELGNIDLEDIEIAEAIYSIYNSFTDTITIKWYNASVYMRYKTDLSDCFKDIIKMLNQIKENKECFTIYFPSQTFFEVWEFSIKDKIINIEWLGINEKHDAKTNDKISIDKNIFIQEWLKLLIQIKEDLAKVGYNSENLEDFYLLENLDRFLINE